jgi:hypothetical protein
MLFIPTARRSVLLRDTRSVWLCVCAMAMLTSLVRAEIFQLDDSEPYLSINGVPIQWNSGGGAQWVLSSLLVRVHPRGLYFKPQTWHARDMTGLGWATDSCIPSSAGMCQTPSSIIFPSDRAPVVNQDLIQQQPGGGCQSTSTGRVVTNRSRYDTSACDVLGASLDYVYHGNTIRHMRTELPAWIYWTVCVLVIYLVRCLSKYILGSLERKGDKNSTGKNEARNPDSPNSPTCLAACLACLVLIASQGDACFVTEEDLIFYRFTIFYVAVYASLFIGTRTFRTLRLISGHDPQFYNLLAGVLQLVAARLYVGAETPYTPPLIFIVAVRAMVKCRRRVDLILCSTLLLDAFMLGLMCAWGFSPDPLYLIALFAGAAAWADFLV